MVFMQCVPPPPQVAPPVIADRPSTISAVGRRTVKAASCDSDRCLALRRGQRPLPSQTPSYSTYNSMSFNSGARRQIWTSDSMSAPLQSKGYSRGPEIFRAVEAKRAKEKEAAAKAAAKESAAVGKSSAKPGDPGLSAVPNVS